MDPARGHSLLEMTLVLAVIGLLAGLAPRGPQGSPALTAVQGELRAGVEQAFLLARASGREVRLALGGHTPACAGRHPALPCGEVPPLILPRGVRWGLPATGVPLPDGMAATVQAHRTGWAHPCITVTPRHTALGSAWFLTDGRDAVCLRLGDHGEIQLLRWRHGARQWRRA